MATIVLGVVGALVGGPFAPVTAAIGAGVGAYIDQRYIFPAIFPPKPIVGPRIKKFQSQEVSEGGPFNYCFGPLARMEGTVIWKSKLIEVKRKKSQGGKGGPGAKIVNYAYYLNCAVAVCKGPATVKKIWADGKLLYNSNPDLQVTSNQISAKKRVFTTYVGGSHANARVEHNEYFLEVTCPDSVFNLNQFVIAVDRPIRVTGFATAANNFNPGFFAKHLRDNGDGTHTIRIKAGANNEISTIKDEAAGALVTLYQVAEPWDIRKLTDINLYSGGETQTADPLIEADEGVGNVPGYRGTCYAVMSGLALEYYGNRLPIFSFLVEAQASTTVGSAISAILLQAGLQSSDFDITAVTDILYGYVFTSNEGPVAALNSLMLAYDLLVQETNSKLVFFKRGSTVATVIVSADLAARDYGNDSDGRPVQVTEPNPYKSVTRAVVDYLDRENSTLPASEQDRRTNVVKHSIQKYDVPVAITSADAKAIANRIVQNASRNAQQFALTLPPSYCTLDENDRISFTAYGQTFTGIIEEVTRGVNYVFEISGFVDVVRAAVGHSILSGGQSDQTLGAPSIVLPVRIDIAALQDEHVETPGYYYTVTASDPTLKWTGAAIYESKDGEIFDFYDSVEVPGVIGETVIITSQSEVIVDNDDAVAGTVATGLWQLVSTGDDPYGGTARISKTGGDTYKWQFAVPSAGDYAVYVWFSASPTRTSFAKYTISHSSGTASVTINQKDELISDGWVRIGVFNFTGAHQIVLTAGSDGGSTCADAVRVLKDDTQNKLGVGIHGTWDRINTVSVRLYSGELESRTAIEVMNGFNFALIGSEIIGFQTATLTAANTYTLSNLLRGMRGTQHMIDSHRPGEMFVLLDKDTVKFRPLNLAELNLNRQYKVGAPGDVIENLQPITFRAVGATSRPLPPARLKAQIGTDSAANAIKLSWFYRSGRITRPFNTSKWAKTIDDLLGFDIEVLNIDQKVVLTFSSWLSSTWGDGTGDYFFNSFEQANLGIGAGQIITFRVYQLSRKFGRGLPAIITNVSTV